MTPASVWFSRKAYSRAGAWEKLKRLYVNVPHTLGDNVWRRYHSLDGWCWIHVSVESDANPVAAQ